MNHTPEDLDFFERMKEFFIKHPPGAVIDDTGIKFLNDVPLPAKYTPQECSCGVLHKVEADTWYHAAIPLDKEKKYLKVIKRCRKCHEMLLLKLSSKE